MPARFEQFPIAKTLIGSVIASCIAVACGSSDDNKSTPERSVDAGDKAPAAQPSGGEDAGMRSGGEATTSDDAGDGATGGAGGNASTSSGVDAGRAAGATDAGSEDSASDAGGLDAGTVDAGTAEVATGDAGVEDTGTDSLIGPPAECGVWLSTDGDDSNDGSESSPVATLAAAYDLICPKPPDGVENGTECLGPAPRTICVKAGTYPMTERFEFRKTRMGTADNRITLQGDPGAAARPVFDFSEQERLSCGANPDNLGGLTINAHYVTVRDLAIKGANDNCILVQGYEGIVANVETYECADTGIQISSGGQYDNSGHQNLVLNCDSHDNDDVQCDGQNADGFAIKIGTGPDNAFIGCRAWNNSSDGFDLYGWTSPVRIENSWAFDQCESAASDINCDGFKLGGDEISAQHELKNLTAVGNSSVNGRGFTANTNPANLTCIGTCSAWDNTVDVEDVARVSTDPVAGVTIESMSADVARNPDGSLKPISEL
jgi:hypothetical protein